MRIGLDIHGVIDKHRSFFTELTQMIRRENESNGYQHEVHIMTGPSKNKLKPSELDGIYYTHFFSIVDYLKSVGEVPWFSEKDDTKSDPWFDNVEKWNKAKALYAQDLGLHFVIDDTALYAQFFTTPIAIIQKLK